MAPSAINARSGRSARSDSIHCPGPARTPSRRFSAAAEPAKQLTTGIGSSPSPVAVQHHQRSGTFITALGGAGLGERDEELRGVAVTDVRERVALGRGQRRIELDAVHHVRGDGDHRRIGLGLMAGRGRSPHAVGTPLDLDDGIPQPHALAEQSGQGECDPLVSARDARCRLVADVGEPEPCPSRAPRRPRLADEISRRARIASRAPGAIASESSSSRAVGVHPSHAICSRASATAATPIASSSGVTSTPPRGSRIPYRIPLSQRPSPSWAASRGDLGVAGQDELGAHLDHGTVAQLPRPGAPADAETRLEHLDVEPARSELTGGDEPGEPGADD